MCKAFPKEFMTDPTKLEMKIKKQMKQREDLHNMNN